MPVAPPKPPTAVAPRLPAEEGESHTAAWIMIASLFVFKLVALGLILAVARFGQETFAVILALNWPYLVLLVVLLALLPLGFWLRLLRVRVKRRALQAAEWRLD